MKYLPFVILLVLITCGALAIAQTKHGNQGHGNQGSPVTSHGNSGHTNQDFTNDVALMADLVGAGEYGFASSGMLTEGFLISLTGVEILFPENDLRDGIFWGPMGFAHSGCAGSYGTNTVIGVDLSRQPPIDEVSVECGDGYYSCCYCQKVDGGYCPVARCRSTTNGDDPDDLNGDCQGGGYGSTKCSIDDSDCPDDDDDVAGL